MILNDRALDKFTPKQLIWMEKLAEMKSVFCTIMQIYLHVFIYNVNFTERNKSSRLNWREIQFLS